MRYGIFGLLACSLFIPSIASAENRTWTRGDQTWIQEGSCIVVKRECTQSPDRLLRRVPDPSPHHLLYLNRCRGGETFTSSYQDESRLNQSSIIWGEDRAMSEFPHSDQTWNSIVKRVRAYYAPFNIRVTDIDPGAAPHAEIAICGSGAEWGIVNSGGTYVAGISPMDCDVIPNSISFVFPVDIGDKAQSIAETASHEAGHALSLNHELLCTDLMSYDCAGVTIKDGFVDEDSQCVVYDENLAPTVVDCSCEPADRQNTHQSLLAAFGPGTPALPTVEITEPRYNDVVVPGFPIKFTADDYYDSVRRAELWVDGSLSLTVSSPPFFLNAPAELADGSHEIEVRIEALYGDAADSVMVVVGPQCQGPEDCLGGETCVEGRCTAGPGVAGGLGETCQSGDDCASGLCANDGIVKRCIEICDPARQGCPSDFICVHAGDDDGVCWPNQDESVENGGCAVTRDPALPWLPIGLSLLISFALFGRRRRG